MAVMWEICAEWRMSTCGSVGRIIFAQNSWSSIKNCNWKNFQLSNLIFPFLWDICASRTVFENPHVRDLNKYGYRVARITGWCHSSQPKHVSALAEHRNRTLNLSVWESYESTPLPARPHPTCQKGNLWYFVKIRLFGWFSNIVWCGKCSCLRHKCHCIDRTIVKCMKCRR